MRAQARADLADDGPHREAPVLDFLERQVLRDLELEGVEAWCFLECRCAGKRFLGWCSFSPALACFGLVATFEPSQRRPVSSVGMPRGDAVGVGVEQCKFVGNRPLRGPR